MPRVFLDDVEAADDRGVGLEGADIGMPHTACSCFVVGWQRSLVRVAEGAEVRSTHRASPAGTTRPGPIDQAVRSLQDRPAEPWSTTTLALEVHPSVRALQEGFQRHVGTPPMRYLRELRLRRVHEELRRAQPGSTTVTAVPCTGGSCT